MINCLTLYKIFDLFKLKLLISKILKIFLHIEFECVSVVLNANSAIFQLYHGENKLIFNEIMMRSALYQTNTLLVEFLQCQLTETTVCGQTCRPTPDSEPTRLCSFSLMLHAQWKSNNLCQFYNLWFDPIRTRTHDLQHSR